MSNERTTSPVPVLPSVNRRTFIKASATVAAAAGVGGSLFRGEEAHAEIPRDGVSDLLETSDDIELKYSVCLACHGACGIKARVQKSTDVLLKLDGSPYHPNGVEDEDRIEQSTSDPDSSREAGVTRTGRMCAKGQSGLEAIYSPTRITAPLKRKGARGSGKWEMISWSQAIDEIADALLPYWTQGPDPDYAGDKTQYLIDPDIPELGYINNQVVFLAGRLEHGQKEFTDRWFRYGFGTATPRVDHTSICETSHHVGTNLMTEKQKSHAKPDLNEAEFVIFFGTNPLEANFPMVPMSRKLMNMRKRSGTKIAVVDPRFSNSASKADWWVPIIPGTDAALALGMLRWMVDNSDLEDENASGNRVDVRFLRNGTRAAAEADGEPNHCDATWLVRRDDGKYAQTESGEFYLWDGQEAVSFSPSDTTNVVEGELLTPADGVLVDGVPCDSVFSLLYDRLQADYDVDTCASVCGIEANLITTLAAEFTAHGKKAAAEAYRGAVKHTNGIYNQMAVNYLNLAIGNVDWKGGLSFGGGHYHEVGGHSDGQVSLKKAIGNATPYEPVGPRYDRAGSSYDDMPNLIARDGFPALRPWFPVAYHGVSQEIYPSVKDGYPYPMKVMFSYWLAWNYSAPASRDIANQVLRDEELLPLHVCFDIEFGETAVLADYILPDTTYLERFSTPHTAPTMLTQYSGFRHPVVGTLDEDTGEFTPAIGDPSGDPEYSPMMLEDFFSRLGQALAEKAGRPFPGIGANGWDLSGASSTTTRAWHADQFTAWDYFSNVLNNLEIESGHTAQSILDHGGAFEPLDSEYDGDMLNHRYNFKTPLHFYSEVLATTNDSMRLDEGDKQYFDPLAQYQVVKDVLDQPVEDDDYPFVVVTWKPVYHTQARTAICPTLMMLQPENFVWMNSADARAVGVETGDTIRITSSSHSKGVEGKVWATEGIRPGIIGVSNSFGRWEAGSRASEVDGVDSDFDPRRARGVHTNEILRLDPVLGDVALTDKIGGSASFFDTRVQVTKVS